jgi:hypothetical protein
MDLRYLQVRPTGGEMTKPKPAGPIALKLREFMNQNEYTVEEINRAMVILSNQSLHHLLGNDNTKGSPRKRDHGQPRKPDAEPPINKGVEIEEFCKS